MRSASPLSHVFTFGGRVPAAVGGLIVAIVAASLLGALFPELGAAGALRPDEVWRGQVWRLGTWLLFEERSPVAPMNLLFGALTLFWFGRDLCHAWGSRRFLITFFGVAAGAAALTCALARFVLPGLMGGIWSGPWAAITTLLVAWSMLFPERQMMFNLVLPVTGRTLFWLTIGGTVLWAAFSVH